MYIGFMALTILIKPTEIVWMMMHTSKCYKLQYTTIYIETKTPIIILINKIIIYINLPNIILHIIYIPSAIHRISYFAECHSAKLLLLKCHAAKWQPFKWHSTIYSYGNFDFNKSLKTILVLTKAILKNMILTQVIMANVCLTNV